MRRSLVPMIVAAVAFLSALALAGSAGAGQPLQGTIHVEDEFDIEGYCGVQGLHVRITLVIDGRVRVVPHGPDGLEYFLQTGTYSEVDTNLANGRSVRSTSTVMEKDQFITDNGDGTLTIVVLATGNAVLYDESGKAIARNPGQLRFELLVYPDGSFVRGDVVKGSTGRSDDFCDAAVAALGA